MPNVFQVEGTVLLVALLVSVAVKIFAFVSSLIYSREAYEAANKLNKPTWCVILGVGVAAALLLPGSPLNLISLAFLIAALVYLADVRPALSSLSRR